MTNPVIVHTRPREAMLEALLFRSVQAMGGMALKLAPTVKGMPDRLVILPMGRMYLIELKADGGKLSPIQKHWHLRAKSMGAEVTVLTGVEEIKDWLRAQIQVFDPTSRPGRKPGSRNRPKPTPEPEQQLAPAGTTVDTIGD